VITFLDYPEDKQKLKWIITELEKLLKINIWNNGYEIEVVTGDAIDNKDGSLHYPTDFIPLENYKQKRHNPDRVLHLLSPEEKAKYMKDFKEWRELTAKKRKPLPYKYKLYQEKRSNSNENI
jgi:hypothetical protein